MNGPPDIQQRQQPVQPPVQPQQMQRNEPNEIFHKSVIDMFPELDLTQTLITYGHLNSEALASLILDTIQNIPRKRGPKRKVSEISVDDAPASVTASEQSFTTEISDNSNVIGKLLINKMLWDMSRILKAEIQKNKQIVQEGIHLPTLKNALADHFPSIRLEFITKFLSISNSATFPTSIACFFIENKFTEKLKQAFPNISQNFWNRASTPLVNKRTKKMCHNIPNYFIEQYKLYTDLLASYRDGEYSALLTSDLKLTEQYDQIAWIRPNDADRIECLVCFDMVPMNRVIFCNAPVTSAREFLASQLSIINNFDEPGPSRLIYEELDELHVLKDKENSDPQVHAFCRTCVRGSASAAVGEVPLAKGGIGLRCMVPDCENPILYSEFRPFLSKDIQKKLDERIVEENIGMASLVNLERCKKCNFAIEMEVDKTINKVFDCLACGAKMCRLCERNWDDEHFGLSCDELDAKEKKDKRDRALEKQLNEAIIRKCPRCGIAFMKLEGCNKMTCRCGMTQCYICRESKIGYDHFCPHFRDPRTTKQGDKCSKCNKTCLLHEDAKKKDEQLIKEIREKDKANVDPVEVPEDNNNNNNNAAAVNPPNNPTPPRVQRRRQPPRAAQAVQRNNNNNNAQQNAQNVVNNQEREQLDQLARLLEQRDQLMAERERLNHLNAVEIPQLPNRLQQEMDLFRQNIGLPRDNIIGHLFQQPQRPNPPPPPPNQIRQQQQVHQPPPQQQQNQFQRLPVPPRIQPNNNGQFHQPPHHQFVYHAHEFMPAQRPPNQAVNPRQYEVPQYQQAQLPPPVPFRPYYQQPPPIPPHPFLNPDNWMDRYLREDANDVNNNNNNMPNPPTIPQRQQQHQAVPTPPQHQQHQYQQQQQLPPFPQQVQQHQQQQQPPYQNQHIQLPPPNQQPPPLPQRQQQHQPHQNQQLGGDNNNWIDRYLGDVNNKVYELNNNNGAAPPQNNNIPPIIHID